MFGISCTCFGFVIATLVCGIEGIHDARMTSEDKWSWGSSTCGSMANGTGSSYCDKARNDWHLHAVNDGTANSVSNPSIDHLSCTGTENSIHQCVSYTILPIGTGCLNNNYLWFHVFSYYGDNYVYNFFRVRLVNGPSAYNGRLELYFHGEWGTVCDDGFGRNEAKVVCRMLGFENPIGFAYKRALYGKGKRHIYFDRVNCHGYESTLQHCDVTFHDGHTCVHSEDVGVFCAEELTFALCVGAAVLLVIIVVTTIVIVFVVRRCKKTDIDCATADLAATQWDLLLVVDLKDVLTHMAGQIMDSLAAVEPSAKVKRTQVHRLNGQSEPVKCKRVIFFLCKLYTSTEQCYKLLLPKLNMKEFSTTTIQIIVTDLECKLFEELNVKREVNNTFSITTIENNVTSKYWQVSFIRLYFQPAPGKTCTYRLALSAEDNSDIQGLTDTVTGILKELGINEDVVGDNIAFKLIIKHTGDSVTPNVSSNRKVPEFIFVKRMRKQLKNESNIRLFALDEVLTGILAILSESKAIKQKCVVKRPTSKIIV